MPRAASLSGPFGESRQPRRISVADFFARITAIIPENNNSRAIILLQCNRIIVIIIFIICNYFPFVIFINYSCFHEQFLLSQERRFFSSKKMVSKLFFGQIHGFTDDCYFAESAGGSSCS